MKYILSITLLASLSIFSRAHASDKATIFLGSCNNFGTGVSYMFQSCVNSNFSTISREIGGFYSSCTNFSTEVDYFFTSCVNSGFRQAQRELGNSVWVQDCANYDRKTLDYSFISCVNSNFSQIQRVIK